MDFYLLGCLLLFSAVVIIPALQKTPKNTVAKNCFFFLDKELAGLYGLSVGSPEQLQ